MKAKQKTKKSNKLSGNIRRSVQNIFSTQQDASPIENNKNEGWERPGEYFSFLGIFFFIIAARPFINLFPNLLSPANFPLFFS
jgi:hypothetical protein